MQRSSRLALVSSLVFAVACGAGRQQRTTLPEVTELPAIDGPAAFDAGVRLFESLPLDAPSRGPLRDRLLGYLGDRTSGVVQVGDYDAIVEHLRTAADLFLPNELGPRALPASIEPAARAAVEKGSELGDEGGVLGALCLLRLMHPDDASLGQEYDRVARWSTDTRSRVENAFEAESGLLDVWNAHAAICPTREVLDRVADVIEARRDAAFSASSEESDVSVVQQLVSLSALEVAGVYLGRQDLDDAIRRVSSLGNGQLEQRLRAVLERARQGEGRGSADSIAELSEVYVEGRPQVARGTCLLGRRMHPGDARFPLCLARLAASASRSADATAYYAEAIERAPSQRPLYDEALQALSQFIGGGLFDADPDEARALVGHAERILGERMQRWPNDPPAVSFDQFHLLVGMLAMNAGDVDEAARRFQASVEAQPTPQALLQWGLLEERRGRPAEAARHYREALDLTPQDGADGALARAELLEHLGDAYHAAGDATQSNRMYSQALGLYRDVRDQVSMDQLAAIETHRGGMLLALGRADEARQAFLAALEAAPFARETYAGVLSRLAVAPPDPELALEVFRRAMHQLSLDPEWRVYFALWVRMIEERGGVAPDDEVLGVFRSLSQGDAWYARLARFGAGEMSGEDLLASATSVGERCEALFYDGARRLGSGDRDGARRRFEEALQTHMVMFFEYTIAQSLLPELGATAAAPEAPASTAAMP